MSDQNLSSNNSNANLLHGPTPEIRGKQAEDAFRSNVEDNQPEQKDSSNSQEKPSPSASPPAIPIPVMASFKEILSLADKKDKFLLVVALISSFLMGGTSPVFGIMFGDISNEFDPYGSDEEMDENVKKLVLRFVIVGAVFFVLCTISTSVWIIFGERLGMKYRIQYLKTLLEQDVQYYDQNKPEQIPTQLSTDCTTIVNGMGHKFGTIIDGVGMLLLGLIFAMYFGWQLALVLLIVAPLLTIGTFWLFKVMRESFMAFFGMYSIAGGHVQQALGNVKTVVAFGGEDAELEKYKNAIVPVMTTGKKNGIKNSFVLGIFKFIIMGFYFVGFAIGSVFVKEEIYIASTDKDYDSGSVIGTLFCMIFASFSVGAALPGYGVLMQARIAAKKIIDLISTTDANRKTKGKRKIELTGQIEFRNVKFSYPTRKEVQILKGISAIFQPKKKTAICGESGSGKTTIIQLIEAFYQLNEGTILIDGVDIKELDIQWLRKQIGFVQQEPVLFNMSIMDNIRLGKEDATEQEIMEACQKANCMEFIGRIGGLQANAGESGSRMSGGQKQRIAIARAIIKKPKILLLDEATSALDPSGEREVLQALENVSEGITTISIAHRLTTIQNAHNIIVMKEGQIAEEGNVQQLMDQKGVYYELYQHQVLDEQAEMSPLKKDPKNVEKVNQKTEDNSPNEEEALLNNLIQQEKKESDENDKRLSTHNFHSTSRIIKENLQHKGLIMSTIFCSIVGGAVMPCFSIFFTRSLMAMQNPDKDELKKKALFNSGMIGILSLCDGISTFLMLTCFAYMAQNISFRLRSTLYKTMLKMHLSWFDKKHNISANLSKLLSEDTTIVNSVVENILGTYIQSFIGLAIAFIIAFCFCWEMALFGIAVVPFAIMVQVLIRKAQNGIEASVAADSTSASIISESVQNIRTVASFANINYILKIYKTNIEAPLKKITRNALVNGLSIGSLQLLNFLSYGYCFYFCSYVVREYDANPEDAFISFYIYFCAAVTIGGAAHYTRDLDKAAQSLKKIFSVLDSQSKIEIPENEGSEERIKGDIEFRNVYFKYEGRDNWVLNNLNLKMKANRKTGICGPSGHGKSTIIQLLLRFYDIQKGEILIDGKDIRKYNLKHLRSSLGYVSQEPVLFDSSIRENILYGFPSASEELMQQAAKTANADKFIMKDEEQKGKEENPKEEKTGFDRIVGNKGTQLSGGEKQRIAIARAIIRNPAILLLDEATSALDRTSESEVNEGLKEAMKDRTSVIIAHRISTIKEAEDIFVIENGKVVEEGSYDELMRKKERFFDLANGIICQEKDQ